MDRIILPYSAQASANLPARPAAPVLTTHPPKAASDFLRAVRRRIPLILIITVLVGSAGAAYVVRLPDTFRASGIIQIEPPHFDANTALILGNGIIPTTDRDTNERYIPNRLAQLTGRKMAEAVVYHTDLGIGQGSEGDPGAEILQHITTRKLPLGANHFEAAIEGRDPERVYKLLDQLLDTFRKQVEDESLRKPRNSMAYSKKKIGEFQSDIDALNEEIKKLMNDNPIFTFEGKNLLQEDYSSFNAMLVTKKIRFEDLRHESRISAMYPALKQVAPPSKNEAKIQQLLDQKEKLQGQINNVNRLARSPRLDPSGKHWSRRLDETNKNLEEYAKLDVPAAALPNRADLMLDLSAAEIQKLQRQVNQKLQEIQASMPTYQKYLELVRERDQKTASKLEMERRYTQFNIVSENSDKPVEIILAPTLPGGPVGPNRPFMIGAIGMLGFLLGTGLVCALEFLDHSVKIPEHLTGGLGLPLFGVIPKIRRLARTHRGGHLWTHSTPQSLEADAYRNLRASIVGLTGANGPAVTLLVTSAKAGEGKSTTALNLAATCARAGERTLLMDVDLRRPSLGEVFESSTPHLGLVDVLRGDMPWQQATIRTDIPNLDFLPTGDPAGVPIEILGTLELRQLIAAVSKQYHRVILDGPAILGLADCRMLGRAADASLLVVRSGAHDLRPLRRAKEMLEQSQISIAGVVFNGLNEDLENWLSYGFGDDPIRMPPRKLTAEPVAAATSSDTL